MSFSVSPALALAAGLVFLPLASAASVVSLAITDAPTEIVGTSAVINGSGSASNTRAWQSGEFAAFELTDLGSSDTYTLNVAPIAWTGSFGPGATRDNLMIARTVNSQGLNDPGTLSIYMRPDNNSGAYSATFRFSLFDPTSGAPAPLTMNVISLDIDFNQRMQVDGNSITGYGLSPDTDIQVSQTGSELTFRGPGQAGFADPQAAVELNYVDTSTFDITFAHSSVALYMLEFRTPSAVLTGDPFITTVMPVPLPAGALLLLGGLAGLAGLRWRSNRG